MFPMGFDAFGLPAENAAIKRNIDPKEWTYQNIERMRGQLRLMGAGFDWDREVVTSDPEYYKWTQWWFLQFYKHGLAYQAESLANWCPGCQTVLANEQVLDGKCERSDDVVERKMMRQWFFKITTYAEELPATTASSGPSASATCSATDRPPEGAQLDFKVDVPGVNGPLTVFTTRPDTVYGATFMVIAPEHPLVARITTRAAGGGRRASPPPGALRSRPPFHRTREDRCLHRRQRNQSLQRRAHPDLDRGLVPVTYGTGADGRPRARLRLRLREEVRVGVILATTTPIDVTKPPPRHPVRREDDHPGPFDGTPRQLSRRSLRTLSRAASARGNHLPPARLVVSSASGRPAALHPLREVRHPAGTGRRVAGGAARRRSFA
jgi:hypothetical protein